MRALRRTNLLAGWSIRGRFWSPLLLLGIVSLGLLLVGCPARTGSYAPLDWAYEMHYTPSYRSQEPPRLTSPDGAVPHKAASDPRAYTREIVLANEAYAELANPIARTPETQQRGEELFRVNCAFCHGSQGEGDGPVSVKLREHGGIPAANLKTGSARLKPPGELFRLVSVGGNTATRFGMARFRLLLSPEDRWLLVDYVLSLQGR